ncbi:MAG TPA: IS21 family transposase [Acidimicrobiales bacterium]|nr:IS21 family transposase [Acidimicrobiales bacterium]
MFEVREVLRLWLRGETLRGIERLSRVDRKTVRRYVEAAVAQGVAREGGEDQLGDELIGSVVEAVRPHRSDGHGEAWRLLIAHHDQIKTWLNNGLTVVKCHDLLTRQGVVVPERTLHRYALEVCGHRRGRGPTVRIADGRPGDECQIDFGRMGTLHDPASERMRAAYVLVFTACFSRHCFVWVSFSQTTEAVIEGCEAAWTFFGGVFATVIPDNMSSVIDKASPTEPRFNQAFVEYAQSRGFVIDPARVRKPQDKPRVERVVPYVRASFFAGERFVDRDEAQRRAEEWCATNAGLRIHGTTQCRPAELFALEEAARLLPAPTSHYDVPLYASAKVHRDHHIEVGKALYSIPGNLIGSQVDARADAVLVKVFFRGQLVKVHPRKPPGGRSTDPADLPSEKTVYAMRDIERLQAMAAAHGPAVGTYARALLDIPLPWTRMRQVYSLLGLVKKWGPARVDAACVRALEAEAISVSLIGRMLERATENHQPPSPPGPPAPTGRFARGPEHFASGGAKRPHSGANPVPDRPSTGLSEDGSEAHGGAA